MVPFASKVQGKSRTGFKEARGRKEALLAPTAGELRAHLAEPLHDALEGRERD